jgi:Holliday junction resolvasome RuvABC endonuclease subunit
MKTDTILAIDPGLREPGLAVVSGRRLLLHETLWLRDTPRRERLSVIQKTLAHLTRTHRPRAVVVEKTYRHPVPWLDELHEITLTARLLARRAGAQFATYSAQTVRRTVAGYGKARKPEVALAVTHRFPQLRVLLTQDRRWKERYWLNMFDAVALALHHQTTQPPSRSR